MDRDTLVAGLEFARMRLLGTLDAIEKSGQDAGKVLSWRPGLGRAHIAWQAMHCAATHDRYLNAGILHGAVKDQALVANFAGGTTPSDSDVPTLAMIRQKFERDIRAAEEICLGTDVGVACPPGGRPRGKDAKRGRVAYLARLARITSPGADSFDVEFV